MSDQVFDQIDRRLTELRAHALGDKRSVWAPLLVLGTSERVGSNWLSDALRGDAVVHNEPWRQQLGQEHPLSALNPAPTGAAGIVLGELGQHWLDTFVLSKYGAPRHVVKETNLFFATATVLRLFPDSPIAVLSRSPLGVASSFARSGLWRRWRYDERYAQLRAAARHPGYQRWAPLLPDDDPDELIALTRLVVLGALVLADALGDRAHLHLAYEDRVLDPRTASAALAQMVPTTGHAPCHNGVGPRVDDTFNTRKQRTRLVAALDIASAQRVHTHTLAGLSVAESIADNTTVARAARWLSGDHRYQLSGAYTAPRAPTPAPPPIGQHVTPRYSSHAGLAWRTLLITNSEFAAMLNRLHAAGLPNSYHDTHLLLTVMPHERGGRLHFDTTGGWYVSGGYEHHPVYWVTWIGAAAYAAYAAARLPSYQEMQHATADAIPTNTDYAVGDVVSVVEPGQPAGAVHHLVGNVQVWCADGPVDDAIRPASRYLYGAAWNTPASRTEITRRRARHLLGSSRGVGIRLVRAPAAAPAGLSAHVLAGRLRTWLAALTDRHSPLAHLDSFAIAALTRSQTDVCLGSQVGTGGGETRLAELNEPAAESELR